MQYSIYFLIAYIATVLLTRIATYLKPQTRFTLKQTAIHHFWLGIALLLVSLVFTGLIRVLIFAVGLGFVVDELLFMILGGGDAKRYWSKKSMVGALLFSVIVIGYHASILKSLF